MADNNMRLVKKNKRAKKRRRKIIFLILLLLVIGAGGYLIYYEFSATEIDVSGCTTYTEKEVETAVKKQYYVPNTIVMTAESYIFSQKYLPFIQTIEMKFDEEDYHKLKIHIKEKLRIGCFSYHNKYVYFDEDGYALESRNRLFDNIPVVTGLQYNKLVLGEKIPVKGDYFNTVMTITKKISAYNLDVSEIHFDGEDNITLVSGDYEIYLGSDTALEGKMSKISEVLKTVSEEASQGTIDMHLYTDEQNIITFRKK